MRMVRVKICGITREEDVRAVTEADGDAVGFIVGFPSSPRNIPIERAAELIRHVPPLVTSVLVTTSDVLARERRSVRAMGPDAIQLYGEVDDPAVTREILGARLIRPFAVALGGAAVLKRKLRGYDALLTDTYRRGFEGGTGLTSDWAVCERIRKAIAPTPMILSGGLTPHNVMDAIKIVRPFAVDVSSGVESSPGVKDPSKVSSFVAGARSMG